MKGDSPSMATVRKLLSSDMGTVDRGSLRSRPRILCALQVRVLSVPPMKTILDGKALAEAMRALFNGNAKDTVKK
jgi:hypothetical protein